MGIFLTGLKLENFYETEKKSKDDKGENNLSYRRFSHFAGAGQGIPTGLGKFVSSDRVDPDLRLTDKFYVIAVRGISYAM